MFHASPSSPFALGDLVGFQDYSAAEDMTTGQLADVGYFDDMPTWDDGGEDGPESQEWLDVADQELSGPEHQHSGNVGARQQQELPEIPRSSPQTLQSWITEEDALPNSPTNMMRENSLRDSGGLMRQIFSTSSSAKRGQALIDAQRAMPGAGLGNPHGGTPERSRSLTLTDGFMGGRPQQPGAYDPWSIKPVRPASPIAASRSQGHDPFGDLPSSEMPEQPQIQNTSFQGSVEANRQFAVTQDEAVHLSALPFTPSMTLSSVPSKRSVISTALAFVAPSEDEFTEQPNQSMDTIWEAPDDDAVRDFMPSSFTSIMPSLEPDFWAQPSTCLPQSRFDFAPSVRTAAETAPGSSSMNSQLQLPSPDPQINLSLALANNVAETAPGVTIGTRALSLPPQSMLSSLPQHPSLSSATGPQSYSSASTAAKDAPQMSLRPLRGLPQMPQMGLGPLLLPDSATDAPTSAQMGPREPSTITDSSQRHLRPAPAQVGAMMSWASPGASGELHHGGEIPSPNQSTSGISQRPEPMLLPSDDPESFHVPDLEQALSQDEQPEPTATNTDWSKVDL